MERRPILCSSCTCSTHTHTQRRRYIWLPSGRRERERGYKKKLSSFLTWKGHKRRRRRRRRPSTWISFYQALPVLHTDEMMTDELFSCCCTSPVTKWEKLLIISNGVALVRVRRTQRCIVFHRDREWNSTHEQTGFLLSIRVHWPVCVCVSLCHPISVNYVTELDDQIRPKVSREDLKDLKILSQKKKNGK